MHYTRDESYYILEAEPHAVVYLGTKTGTEPQAMLDDQGRGPRKKPSTMPALLTRIPARKHDHFLILPARFTARAAARWSSKSAPRRTFYLQAVGLGTFRF